MLVGHTHFDHAVDAPAIARRTGCQAYGSESLLNLMALHGLAERAVVVEPYRSYELGPFEVCFTPSVHSKLLLGLAVPYDGELSCEHLDALSPGAYRCGQVWGISIAVAGVRFYHQGSANLLDEAIRERDVDVFLAGVAGRGFTDDYWRRILPRLNPRAVVPTHYDNFFRPLGQELEFVANVQLAGLPERDRRRQPRDRARRAPPLRSRRVGLRPTFGGLASHRTALLTVLGGDLLDRAHGALRAHAEGLLDRLEVEGRVDSAAAGQPEQLAGLDRQPVLVGRQGQRFLARRRGRLLRQHRHLELALGGSKRFAGNGSWAAIAATSAQLRRKTGTS